MRVFKTEAELLRQCAQGDAGAQRLLAGLYLLGKGVPKDPVAAYLWLCRAGATQEERWAVISMLECDEILAPKRGSGSEAAALRVLDQNEPVTVLPPE